MNGDGYEDFIVAAPRLGGNNGKVYIFAGGPGVTGTLTKAQALATISSSVVAQDWFGYSVSGAGDMDGDGYDDVIVGTPVANGHHGQAYIFRGGPTLLGNLDIASASQTVSASDAEALGFQVAGVGDVNGDGRDDVLISSGAQKVYIYYGAATLAAARTTADADATVSDTDAVTKTFGYSASGAGDVDGDGKADIVISKPKAVNGGKVFVFLGSQLAGAVDSSAASTIITESASVDGSFGTSVVEAGDVDGDGKGDILIGGPVPGAGADWGRGYVFLGKNLRAAMAAEDADTIIIGKAPHDQLGIAVSGAADVNGDGFADIIIGAVPTSLAVPNATGHAYIFYGSSSGIPSCNMLGTCTAPTTLTGMVKDFLGLLHNLPPPS